MNLSLLIGGIQDSHFFPLFPIGDTTSDCSELAAEEPIALVLAVSEGRRTDRLDS